MTPAERFQAEHGERWAAIAQGQELQAALLAVNQPLFDEILSLTTAVIGSPGGNVILARLQGQLLHERALIDLSIITPELSGDLPEATYPDPIEEAAAEEAAISPQASSAKVATAAGSGIRYPQFIHPEPPQPKARRKRRKRRKP